MYSSYFGLSETPFAITPDPRYLFMSRRHQEALAHLLYGVREGGGFVQLTGEVGTGKTTLTRALLEQLPENVDVALVLNPKLTAFEFLATICDDLKVRYPRRSVSIKALIDALNAYLFKAHVDGRRVVLIVDEAQNFQVDVLEQIRLLTNLETTKHKLLQIILVGQPELRELLARPELRQLAQRVTARYHLAPLSREETAAYIKHRVRVGGVVRSLFSPAAIRRIHHFSGGIPRLINIVCDRALLAAYSQDAQKITPKMVNAAAKELRGTDIDTDRSVAKPVWISSVAASLALIAILGWSQRDALRFSETALTAEAPAAALIEPVAADDAREDDSVTTKDASTPVLTMSQFRASLSANPTTTNLDRAFEALFQSWGVDYAAQVGNNGCERAVSARLSCYWANGSWENLVSMNRPAMVWLQDPEIGRKRYVVIDRLDGDDAYIQAGGAHQIVSQDVLREIWNGKYLVLWRPPSLDTKLILPGDRGELVLWLRRNLDKLEGRQSVTADADAYDEELAARVKAFQRRQEIAADGLAGEQTLIHLSTLADGNDVPLLFAEKK